MFNSKSLGAASPATPSFSLTPESERATTSSVEIDVRHCELSLPQREGSGMKRLIFLVLLLGLGFYVGWPAWSGYKIKSALDNGDETTLANKIDFASVKESLRPAAYAYAERYLDQTLKSAGPASTVLDSNTRKAILPKVVDQSLDRLVTPATLIRVAKQGGSVKSRLATLIKDNMGSVGGIPGLGNLSDLTKLGKGGGEGGATGLGGLIGAATKGKVKIDGLGGLFGGDDTPAKEQAAPKKSKADAKEGDGPAFGVDNIKSLGFAGPLGLQVGVAQDPAAKEPDLTAEMGFTGMDWKLVALRPRI
jgi:Protein of unknown function (DUF2939)